MWEYNYTPSSDEIYHADKKKHKYIAKVGEGKNAKYFYSQKEYQAYLKSKKKAGLMGTVRTNTDLGNGETTEHIYNWKGKEVGSYSYVLGRERKTIKNNIPYTTPKKSSAKKINDFTTKNSISKYPKVGSKKTKSYIEKGKKNINRLFNK